MALIGPQSHQLRYPPQISSPLNLLMKLRIDQQQPYLQIIFASPCEAELFRFETTLMYAP